MWTQFGVLFISAVGQIVAAGVLTLNHAGKRTPALLYAALVRLSESNYDFRVYSPWYAHLWVVLSPIKGQCTFGAIDGSQIAPEPMCWISQ